MLLQVSVPKPLGVALSLNIIVSALNVYVSACKILSSLVEKILIALN
jgi:hypothetical protein